MRLCFFLLGSLTLLACGAIKDVASDSRPITHEAWDALLQKHVNEAGWVDYEGFIADSAQLNAYLDSVQKGHPNRAHWTRDEQLAYWINAYNAFTVKLITEHYPTPGIKEIKSGIPFVNTVWDIKFINIEGHEYDLNNIEHNIVRPNFKDPRAHFALNCASYSCPKLQNRAYTAAELDAQLDRAAREFLADERRNKIDGEGPEYVSKLFSWYSGDFKQSAPSVTAYLNRFAPVPVPEGTELEYLDYEWTLNDQKVQAGR